jgi:hypothetical protein
MRTTLARLVTLVLLVSACSGAADEPAETTSAPTTSSSTTTSTTSSTTTTTIDDRERSPVNGLPVDDPELLDRRVLAVKIDNHPNARPQSGIQEAEAVIEIRVEGSFTRFIALFHGTDSEHIGPIRSGRPSDAMVVLPLSATMITSGGQPWVRAGITSVGVPFLTETANGMFRASGRRAPHNLYGSTPVLRETVNSREIPDEPPLQPWLPFGEMHEDAEPANSATITFAGGSVVAWDWDGETWERSFGSTPSEWRDVEGETGRVSADTLVALVGRFFTASPPAGQGGSSVPATSTVGEGRAVVFAEGKAIEGVWSRESAEDPFTLLTADGEPILVPPGVLWLSIVPDVGNVEWELRVVD